MQLPKLRRHRERRALTQEELAEKSGMSVRSVAGYEAGAGARPGSVRKLAAALDIEVEELLEEEGPKKAEAPLPFEEADQEQWRSSFIEGWMRYRKRWTQKWERVHEEEGAALVRRAFTDPEDVEGALLLRCEAVLGESITISEGFTEALNQHLFLYKAGALPGIGRPQRAEIKEDILAFNRVTKKWNATTRAILEAAPEEVDPRVLARLKEQAERVQQEQKSMAALLDQRTSA